MMRRNWIFLSILLAAAGCESSDSSLFDDPGRSDGSLADRAVIQGHSGGDASDASTNADMQLAPLPDGSPTEAAADAMPDILGRTDAALDAKTSIGDGTAAGDGAPFSDGPASSDA